MFNSTCFHKSARIPCAAETDDEGGKALKEQVLAILYKTDEGDDEGNFHRLFLVYV